MGFHFPLSLHLNCQKRFWFWKNHPSIYLFWHGIHQFPLVIGSNHFIFYIAPFKICSIRNFVCNRIPFSVFTGNDFYFLSLKLIFKFRSESSFHQQKQLVSIFEGANICPQTVRKFTDRPRYEPWAVFCFGAVAELNNAAPSTNHFYIEERADGH